MKYKITAEGIEFKKTPEFDAKAILECGQMFRYYPVDGGYEVITGRNIARIYEKGDRVIIKTNNPQRFVDFFDLDTDYTKINKELSRLEPLKKAIEFNPGIRIAKGEMEENIFFFIISQNNFISRIQKIIERMCVIGEPIDQTHRAFPSAKELSRQSMEFFKGLGAGYRDVFLYEASQTLAKTNLNEIAKLDDAKLYSWLLSIKGVGPKVASCIMLYGFNRTGRFPVDTWIDKAYYKFFNEGKRSRPAIAHFFEEKFGTMSGIAQQYLFNYVRNYRE